MVDDDVGAVLLKHVDVRLPDAWESSMRISQQHCIFGWMGGPIDKAMGLNP